MLLVSFDLDTSPLNVNCPNGFTVGYRNYAA
jgi:hypothetical protein